MLSNSILVVRFGYDLASTSCATASSGLAVLDLKVASSRALLLPNFLGLKCAHGRQCMSRGRSSSLKRAIMLRSFKRRVTSIKGSVLVHMT